MKKPYANGPGHSRLSSPVRPVAPHSRRCREIKPPQRSLVAFGLALFIGFVPAAAVAATPTPQPTSVKPSSARRVDLTKVQPKALLPKRAEHTEYVVEINKLGQVARVRSERGNGDPTFNAQTYGNALQAFIRTPDGHVVVGTYRLTYDFDPKTTRVRRDVMLVRQGGVNPDAQGAALDLLSKAHTHTPMPQLTPNPASSIDPRKLPDLNGVMAPKATPSPH